MTARAPVEHWFDFICPFCYVGQTRTELLRAAGREVRELGFQIHPEIGPGGAPAPHRVGPMYDQLAEAARAGGLTLNWSPRIAYSRPALALSEVVRTSAPDAHPAFVRRVFDACFARGLDIETRPVLLDCLRDAGAADPDRLLDAARGEGERSLSQAQDAGRAAGVTGTPAWLIDGRLVTGLQPQRVFQVLAEEGRS